MTLRPVDDSIIRTIWQSAVHLPALSVADGLALFPALNDSPATSEELAGRLSVEVRAADVLATLMVSLGLLVRTDGRFHLTEVARECLLPGGTYYWGPFLQRTREAPLDANRLLGQLKAGGTDGRVAGIWNTQQLPPPEKLRAFTHTMHCQSLPLAVRAVPGLDLAKGGTFLDVAGGSGAFCIAALLRHPELRCTLFDLPPVCEVAREYAQRFGVEDRIEFIGGDMFNGEWPSGRDVAFLNDIFHDWDDVQCLGLAKSAHKALSPGGRIIVHELLLADDRNGPLDAATYSMMMLFATPGRQRSGVELSAILGSAGFTDIRLTPTTSGYVAVQGIKR